MKKLLNTLLIIPIILLSNSFVFAKDKSVDTQKIAKKNDEVVNIIKPEKTKKVNQKRELKKSNLHQKNKEQSSKEAEGMYETKFPVIDSSIDITDISELGGEVSLDDCIKLAITHHPEIMSALSNAEVYKSRVGQAWSNYFPTFSAGVSYSKNDMFMTMGGAMARTIPQKYGLYYVPNISADMLLFDFGKTKAQADSANKIYESSRYDAETSIENVIYNVKVTYYNLVFAKIQKDVYA